MPIANTILFAIVALLENRAVVLSGFVSGMFRKSAHVSKHVISGLKDASFAALSLCEASVLNALRISFEIWSARDRRLATIRSFSVY